MSVRVPTPTRLTLRPWPASMVLAGCRPALLLKPPRKNLFPGCTVEELSHTALTSSAVSDVQGPSAHLQPAAVCIDTCEHCLRRYARASKAAFKIKVSPQVTFSAAVPLWSTRFYSRSHAQVSMCHRWRNPSSWHPTWHLSTSHNTHVLPSLLGGRRTPCSFQSNPQIFYSRVPLAPTHAHAAPS